ncbi:MAG: DUF4145 domain-containing protein [Phyllobacteriaceae bacterium]|nr:DUF4145 domain-containing protein [Phyllobacteriaceae bacterium]
MAKYTEPAFGLKSFNCPHCGALASQVWYTTGAVRVGDAGIPHLVDREVLDRIEALIERSNGEELVNWVGLRDESLREYNEEVFFEIPDKTREYKRIIRNIHISECYRCEKLSIWSHCDLLYPLSNFEHEPNEDLSAEIQKDFREASKIVNLSPRDAAALLRLCIQKLCRQVGERGKDVNTDIGNLVRKGLDTKIQKALDIVRVTGNNSVHPGQIDLEDDKQIAVELFSLVNIIADAIISQPKKIDAMYASLPEGARKKIEDRDKKRE